MPSSSVRRHRDSPSSATAPHRDLPAVARRDIVAVVVEKSDSQSSLGRLQASSRCRATADVVFITQIVMNSAEARPTRPDIAAKHKRVLN
jgi:hypothetical protein